MSRRPTLDELRYQNIPKQLRVWKEDFSQRLLEVVWQAYANFSAEVMSKQSVLDISELERTITQELCIEIEAVLRTMDSFEGFVLIHESWELSSLSGTTGRPKQPDIAFVLRAERRVSWPFDAKILNTDGNVAEYIKEVKDNFLSCNYAPYSSEGGMLGYLLSGDTSTAFTNISIKSGFVLQQYVPFPTRSHRVSSHTRTDSRCVNAPHQFSCHHLLLKLT